MNRDKDDGVFPERPILLSTDDSERTGTHNVQQDNDWLTELEHEMEEMSKKWPGSGNYY